MTLVVTDAVVLHAFDYLESSRIFRIITRHAGVRSVLARGARRSGRRFSAALDLYAQGTAELHIKPGRELDTLGAFDLHRARPQLAGSLGRFSGAGIIAELILRCARDAADPALFDVAAAALDQIGESPADLACEATLGGAWRILAELGVAPSVDGCTSCHAPVPEDAGALFSPAGGGILCERCALMGRTGRNLPARARGALRAWLGNSSFGLADVQEARAHQRLLREFLREHLPDPRPLRAFDAWERDTAVR